MSLHSDLKCTDLTLFTVIAPLSDNQDFTESLRVASTEPSNSFYLYLSIYLIYLISLALIL